MINVVKMDLYRMRHSKYLMVVLLGIVAIIAAASQVMSALLADSDSFADAASSLAISFPEVYDTAAYGALGVPFIYTLLEEVTSQMFVLFLVIGLTIFVAAERKDGFVKNIYGQVKHRYYGYVGKMVVTAVYTFLMFMVYAVVDYVASVVRYGSDMVLIGNAGAMIWAKLLVALFITFVFTGLFVSLTDIMRNAAIPMIIGIILSMGVEGLVAKLDLVLGTKISDYLLLNNLGMIRDTDSVTKLLGITGLGLAFLAVYSFADIVITSKRDLV